MTTYTFHIEPRDLLFMRDARPMEASDAGAGANWPRPDQIWHAFIHGFHRRWPDRQDWEHEHRKTQEDRLKSPNSSDRFGGLKTAGPFPVRGLEIFLPCPQDVSVDKDGALHPMRLVEGSGTNLPRPLSLVFQSALVGKQSPPQWISASDYGKYLRGETFVPDNVELYDVERQIGIAIDGERRATIDCKLYQAEYLRLRDNVRLAAEVSCENVGPQGVRTDVIREIANEVDPLILGGQQGMVTARKLSAPLGLPASHVGEGGSRVRWTLLTPAVFPLVAENKGKGVKQHSGGWLPTWVDPDSGQVMLPRGDLPKREAFGRDRDVWRRAVAAVPKFGASLVAARIGKPLVFSGWDLCTGPKPTVMAVPAGAGYVFECQDDHEARDLVKALAWNGGAGERVVNRRSTLFGEKGFGVGVCSILS